MQQDPLAGLFGDPFQGTARGEAIRIATEKERKPLKGRIPGEAGIWIFIIGDLIAFSIIFLVIVSARMDEPEVFEASRHSLHIEFGALNTLLLLVGSLLVVRAIRAMRTGSGGAPLLFGLTWLCGLIFVVNKGIEYSMLINDGHSIDENLFYGYYFIGTALHLFHLVIGMIGMFVAYRISKRAVHTNREMQLAEVFGAYWHLVDLLWVILFPLLYLMRV
ncbi:cytochrome c oxidase subunit 3 [Sporichthya sp.]|uniref:cytochrome c oxidase subunit 3 n=1 Tax=Sporichthya sp. TaxID=65475 RepID=UPI0025F6C4C4|nr:cytochrome c oxidase subunit 3 [Sporichthya sp.]